MAKKKPKLIEPEAIEEAIEVLTEEDIIEDAQPIAESEIVDEAVIEVEEPEKVEPEKNNQFLYAQLKVINKMTDTAKAKRLSARVQNNYRKR